MNSPMVNRFAEMDARWPGDHEVAPADHVGGTTLRARARSIAGEARSLGRIKPALTQSYLVKGWLTRRGLSVVYGEPNTGKSFFALDLAMHIAAATPWHGAKVAGQRDWEAWDAGGEHDAPYVGPTIYVALEGGDLFANRIEALKVARGDLTKRCDDSEFLYLPVQLDLHDRSFAEDFANALSAMHEDAAALVVIDSLSRAMGADENSTGDMAQLVANIDRIRARFGCHVMLIHHSGKDATKGARGSSFLRGAVDTEIHLTEDDGVTVAEVQKQRDGPTGNRFAFVLQQVEVGRDEDGDAVTSAVLSPARVPDAQNVTGSVSDVDLLRVQRALDGKGARYSDQAPDWAGLIIAATLGFDASPERKRIRRMIEEWLRSGALVKGSTIGPIRKPVPTVEVGRWVAE